MNYVAVPGIKDIYRSESAPTVSPDRIIKTVCDHLKLNAEKLKSKHRAKELVYARHLIFYFIRKHTSMTLKSAGLLFNRDHTTVIHSLETLSDIMETEPKVRTEIELLETTIKSGNLF